MIDISSFAYERATTGLLLARAMKEAAARIACLSKLSSSLVGILLTRVGAVALFALGAELGKVVVTGGTGELPSRERRNSAFRMALAPYSRDRVPYCTPIFSSLKGD